MPSPTHSDQPPERWTHTQHFGPAEALGHHLFPTWVFWLQNLDIISSHCAGVDLLQTLEHTPPPGSNLAIGMVSHLQTRRNQRGP